MRVSYSSHYYAPIPEQHVFPMGKFEGLYRYLTNYGIFSESEIIEPTAADWSILSQVHTPRYLDAILNGSIDRKEERRLGLPWSPGLAKRSQHAVRGTINASLMALEDGISGNLAGGTHHSFPDHGEGFCVFNDVCIAIRTLQRAMWVKKVLIIDCDVHQGNGTAWYFRDDPNVFTFSIHGAKNYPFRKQPSTLDVGLDDHTGDRSYLKTLELNLEEIFSRFNPDLVYYLGGIDVLKDDKMGRIDLTMDGLRKRDETVIRAVGERGYPLVLLLSGGYAPTLNQTVEAHAQMYKAATDNLSLFGG